RSYKPIHHAVIPTLMLRNPIVGDVVRACRIRLRSIQMKWKQHAGWCVGCVAGIGLLKCGALICESAHSSITSKIMIKRPIFLDENDDVLDVRQLGATARTRRRRNSAAAASPASRKH